MIDMYGGHQKDVRSGLLVKPQILCLSIQQVARQVDAYMPST